MSGTSITVHVTAVVDDWERLPEGVTADAVQARFQEHVGNAAEEFVKAHPEWFRFDWVV